MIRYNIYITRKIPKNGLEYIRKECGSFEINPYDRVPSKQELIQKVRGRHAILCLLTDPIDAEVIRSAGPQLKVISNYAVGYNNIDVVEATNRKILVTNTPGVLTETTAEMAWTLLFSTARRIIESDAFTRAGKFKGWGPLSFLGMDVHGKTLGIVGAGRIGTAFARMSKGFNMKVLYYSRSANKILDMELNAKKVALPALLRESDFVSLHVPLTSETRHLIGDKELKLMKSTAILINTARGQVVDERALFLALKKKVIWGAGLDVYENEPKLFPGLIRLKNAVLAPHTASGTVETREKMSLLAAQNLVDALKGKRPQCLVNPEALLQKVW